MFIVIVMLILDYKNNPYNLFNQIFWLVIKKLVKTIGTMNEHR